MILLLVIGLNTYVLMQAAAMPLGPARSARDAQTRAAAQARFEQMKKNNDAARGRVGEKKERAQMLGAIIHNNHFGYDQACAPMDQVCAPMELETEDEQLKKALALSLLEVPKQAMASSPATAASSSGSNSSPSAGFNRLSLDRKRKIDAQEVAAQNMNKKVQIQPISCVWWESALVGNPARDELCFVVERQEIGKKIMRPVIDALDYYRWRCVQRKRIKESHLDQLAKHFESFDEILKPLFDKAEIEKMVRQAGKLALALPDARDKNELRMMHQALYDFCVEVVCRALKANGDVKQSASKKSQGQKSAQLKAQEEADAQLAFEMERKFKQEAARNTKRDRVIGSRWCVSDNGGQWPMQEEPKEQTVAPTVTPEEKIEADFDKNPVAFGSVMPWLELQLKRNDGNFLAEERDVKAYGQLPPFCQKKLIKKYPNFKLLIGDQLRDPAGYCVEVKV